MRDVDVPDVGWLPDLPDLPGGDDPVSAALSILLLVVFLPVLIVGLVLLLVGLAFVLVAVLELLLLALLVPLVVLGRVAFGRKWVVEARRGFTPVHSEQAGDWQTSGLWIRQLADLIRQGDLPTAH